MSAGRVGEQTPPYAIEAHLQDDTELFHMSFILKYLFLFIRRSHCPQKQNPNLQRNGTVAIGMLGVAFHHSGISWHCRMCYMDSSKLTIS